MTRCYVGLGSNLGPSKLIFTQTIELLRQTLGITGVTCSRFYETTPVNCSSERQFLNAVVTFDTILSLEALFATLEEIERKMGKTPKAKNADRLLDLDILFYGENFYSNEKYKVPHPSWHQRLFVVQPLADLIPAITLHNQGFSISINILKMVSLLSKIGIEKVTPLYETGQS